MLSRIQSLKIDLKKLKEFNKTDLNDLKFAIVMNGIKNHSTLPKYLDELVSENNLDEEEQEILHTLLKRFMIILMQIDDLFLGSKFILDVGTICHNS